MRAPGARNVLPLTPEKFEALLKWLDPDREVAGQKYEIIRAGLVRIFVAKCLSDAESLADEVINRVADKLPEVAPGYVGEPVRYFRGVARKLVLEARRGREVATGALPERPVRVTEISDELECLRRCLKFFPSEKREMLLDYYVYKGGDKIAVHRIMAAELGITETALRVQAHRARVRLEACVRECVETIRMKRKPVR